jgi:hypothetical protein
LLFSIQAEGLLHPFDNVCGVSDTETFEILTLGDLPISLVELHQSSTYSGLLEGLPTHEMNEELLERHARGRIGPTHVVRPKERRVSRGGSCRDTAVKDGFAATVLMRRGSFGFKIPGRCRLTRRFSKSYVILIFSR